MFNDDEIEDISNKYNSGSKTTTLYDKPNVESPDVYSRFKLGTTSTNNTNNNQNIQSDKPKNENMFKLDFFSFIYIF